MTKTYLVTDGTGFKSAGRLGTILRIRAKGRSSDRNFVIGVKIEIR